MIAALVCAAAAVAVVAGILGLIVAGQARVMRASSPYEL